MVAVTADGVEILESEKKEKSVLEKAKNKALDFLGMRKAQEAIEKTVESLEKTSEKFIPLEEVEAKAQANERFDQAREKINPAEASLNSREERQQLEQKSDNARGGLAKEIAEEKKSKAEKGLERANKLMEKGTVARDKLRNRFEKFAPKSEAPGGGFDIADVKEIDQVAQDARKQYGKDSKKNFFQKVVGLFRKDGKGWWTEAKLWFATYNAEKAGLFKIYDSGKEAFDAISPTVKKIEKTTKNIVETTKDGVSTAEKTYKTLAEAKLSNPALFAKMEQEVKGFKSAQLELQKKLTAGEISKREYVKQVSLVTSKFMKQGSVISPSMLKLMVKEKRVPGITFSAKSMLIEATTRSLLAAIRAGEFGKFGENFADNFFNWQTLKDVAPISGSIQAGKRLFNNESDTPTWLRGLDFAINLGGDAFLTLGIASGIFSGLGIAARAGASGLSKALLAKFTKENLKKGSKSIATGTASSAVTFSAIALLAEKAFDEVKAELPNKEQIASMTLKQIGVKKSTLDQTKALAAEYQ